MRADPTVKDTEKSLLLDIVAVEAVDEDIAAEVEIVYCRRHHRHFSPEPASNLA